MPVNKYHVRSTCWSCGRRISGRVVAVVTTVREDDHQPTCRRSHDRPSSHATRPRAALQAPSGMGSVGNTRGPLRGSHAVSW